MVAAGLGTVEDDRGRDAGHVVVDLVLQALEAVEAREVQVDGLAADRERHDPRSDRVAQVVVALGNVLLRRGERLHFDRVAARGGVGAGFDRQEVLITAGRGQRGEFVGGIQFVRGVLQGDQLGLERRQSRDLALETLDVLFDTIDRESLQLDELGDDGASVQAGSQSTKRYCTH